MTQPTWVQSSATPGGLRYAHRSVRYHEHPDHPPSSFTLLGRVKEDSPAVETRTGNIPLRGVHSPLQVGCDAHGAGLPSRSHIDFGGLRR